MLQLPAQSNKVPLEMTSQSVSQSVIVNPPTTFKIKSDLDAKYYVPDINIELTRSVRVRSLLDPYDPHLAERLPHMKQARTCKCNSISCAT
jgi:hypothetical protein